MTTANPAPVPPPGSDDEDDSQEVCLVCGKPGRGQPCDDCMNNLTMRPRTGAGSAADADAE